MARALLGASFVASSFHRFSSLAVMLAAASCVGGCAAQLQPVQSAAPAPAYDDSHDPIEVTSNAADPNAAVLRRGPNHKIVSEQEFRGLYRAATGSSDLDDDAHRRAVRKNPVLIAFGSGALVLGGGGIAALAAFQVPICTKDAEGRTNAGCGKAALGVGVLALIAGVGAYTLGCEVVKGADCITDGNVGVGGAGLTREGAEAFVARYNASLGEGPPAPPPAQKPSASVQLSPFGIAGSF